MIGTIEMMMMMTLMLWGVWTVKCYSDMSIIEKMKTDFANMNADGRKAGSTKEAHWSLDRFHWLLQGNYGQDHYDRYLRQLREAGETLSYRRFRSIAINAFTTMLSLEYGCSYGYAQKCFIKVVGISNRFNNVLIRKLLEYFNDYIGEDSEQYLCFDSTHLKISKAHSVIPKLTPVDIYNSEGGNN
jgi:hypothetical protein